ncbi:MAG: hypothetical protein FD143_3023 [Ignavibacteria bacterium]|nr:MAG: hypothetical protein FD143_3023 [Ignavibacteria bacterium]KAF0154934.1 MAG: hypothetical protein FD188_3213 [Ignavibacteria bacterium]
MNKSSKSFYHQFRDRGSSYKDAIMVLSIDTEEGIGFEYDWIINVWGEPNESFRILNQKVVHKGDNSYDVFTIELANGQSKKIIFDISKFFGKKNLFTRK